MTGLTRLYRTIDYLECSVDYANYAIGEVIAAKDQEGAKKIRAAIDHLEKVREEFCAIRAG